jgi:hypothetical protein
VYGLHRVECEGWAVYSIQYTAVLMLSPAGRLTSAWNWCQKLDTKPFYPVFRMAGFASFDGKL